jgi:hypothetical protein
LQSAIIVYEDTFYEGLHSLVKALRGDSGSPAMILEATTVRGSGGFASEVPKLPQTMSGIFQRERETAEELSPWRCAVA